MSLNLVDLFLSEYAESSMASLLLSLLLFCWISYHLFAIWAKAGYKNINNNIKMSENNLPGYKPFL